MGEKQEKVWVVTRRLLLTSDRRPVKVFDDAKDAKDYAKHYNNYSRKYAYSVVGVKKG